MGLAGLPKEQQTKLLDLAGRVPVNEPNKFCIEASKMGIATSWQIFTDCYEILELKAQKGV